MHFNSQPHEEADDDTIMHKNRVGHFNSQPHEEADGSRCLLLSNMSGISTHSLTKRLTAILDKNTFI